MKKCGSLLEILAVGRGPLRTGEDGGLAR